MKTETVSKILTRVLAAAALTLCVVATLTMRSHEKQLTEQSTHENRIRSLEMRIMKLNYQAAQNKKAQLEKTNETPKVLTD